MKEEEALSLIVQKRERMNELHKRAVNAKKKQINDASLSIWKPKMYETYYTLSFTHINYNVSIISVKWTDNSLDYIRLLQGMVYRTYEEADHNHQKDYEKLTGLRLTNIKLNPYI